MKKLFLFAIAAAFTGGIFSQTTYTVDINQPEKEIIRDHLDLGGTNPSGEKIDVNSYYIERDGKAFIPIVGEFHYCRYPEEYWEESIRKMKAGGINIISTYVFWNTHERKEGQWDWSGNLNLRKFIEIVKDNDLYAIVRMGPFCHGEMRNGGMPDWLYSKTFEVRSNAPEYLALVDTLYGKIANQIDGLLYKDGGPVIGVQLENEYQHSAAPWEFQYPGSHKERVAASRDASFVHEQITVTDGQNPWFEYGKRHMKTLKEIAKKHGVDVPIYTATGWGNATIVEKGSIPVTAGYAYPFWAKPHPSKFYLFKDIQKDPDYAPVSYNTDLYPSIPAEIGPGIQVKYSRRPVVDYRSVNPLMVRIVGSGSNGIGYYMYHGGSTPSYEGKFYNEESNGIPRINYDFQAPIGQYGQVRYSFKHLRMLHMFLKDYQDVLAPMKTILPETNADIKPDNNETLRYAVRSYGNSGFVFVINFQDHIDVKDIKDVQIKVQAKGETISFPEQGTINMPEFASAILPFNLKVGEANIKSATVQPLVILKNDDGDKYIFSAIGTMKPEMIFSKETKISKIKNATVSVINGKKRITGNTGKPFSFLADGSHIMVLTEDMAINAEKINESLYITNGLLLQGKGELELITQKADNELHVYPANKKTPELTGATINKEKSIISGFSSYSVQFVETKPDIKVEKIGGKYTLSLNSDISALNDVFVNVDYIGDRALAFIKDEMINDHFYHSKKWEISLKPIADKLKNNKMVFAFHPMFSDYTYLEDLDEVLEFNRGRYLEVKDFEIVPEYKASLKCE